MFFLLSVGILEQEKSYKTKNQNFVWVFHHQLAVQRKRTIAKERYKDR